MSLYVYVILSYETISTRFIQMHVVLHVYRIESCMKLHINAHNRISDLPHRCCNFMRSFETVLSIQWWDGMYKVSDEAHCLLLGNTPVLGHGVVFTQLKLGV